jgi:hypothetical protein
VVHYQVDRAFTIGLRIASTYRPRKFSAMPQTTTERRCMSWRTGADTQPASTGPRSLIPTVSGIPTMRGKSYVQS